MAAPKKPMDHLETEAKRDKDAPILIEVWDQSFTVRPMKQWKASGYRAIREGDLDAWGETCMDRASYVAFRAKDPTLEETVEFTNALNLATGESLGE